MEMYRMIFCKLFDVRAIKAPRKKCHLMTMSKYSIVTLCIPLTSKMMIHIAITGRRLLNVRSCKKMVRIAHLKHKKAVDRYMVKKSY